MEIVCDKVAKEKRWDKPMEKQGKASEEVRRGEQVGIDIRQPHTDGPFRKMPNRNWENR